MDKTNKKILCLLHQKGRMLLTLLWLLLTLSLTACESKEERQARKAAQEEFYAEREKFIKNNTIEADIREEYQNYLTEEQRVDGEETIVEEVDVEIQFAGENGDDDSGTQAAADGFYDTYIMNLIVDDSFDDWSLLDQYNYLLGLRIRYEDFMDRLLQEQYTEYAAYQFHSALIKELFGENAGSGISYKTYVKTTENTYEDNSRYSGGIFYKNGKSVDVNGNGPLNYRWGNQTKTTDRKESEASKNLRNGTGTNTGVSSQAGDSSGIKDPYDADIDGYYEDNRDIYDDPDDAYDDWEP